MIRYITRQQMGFLRKGSQIADRAGATLKHHVLANRTCDVEVAFKWSINARAETYSFKWRGRCSMSMEAS